MAFKVDAGVRPRKDNDTTPRIPIYYKGAKKPLFLYCCGRFIFTNSVSATVFSYLNSNLGADVATESVVRMEQKLDQWGAVWADKAPSAFDLVTMLPGGKFLEVGKKAIETGGSQFMAQQQSNRSEWSEYNPYEPRAGSTWSGSAVDEYVDYALAWWGKDKKNGPAYQLLRDSPLVRSVRR